MNLTALLLQAGFVNSDQVKDFGAVLKDVDYLFRKKGDVYEYVSLMYFEGRLLEVVYEGYLAPKNTRKPKGDLASKESLRLGYTPQAVAIYRSADAVLAKLV